jgi:CHRD domain
MKKLGVLTLALLMVVATGVAFSQGIKAVSAVLIGYQEVPAISTVGGGEFKAKINADDTEVQYELSYSNLEGDVLQAHIHFAQTGVNGGITVFLCTNLGNGPPGTQLCPPSPATITGSITADEVTAGAIAQGLGTGEFGEFLKALRAGKLYANVHSTTFPGGEVRGQLHDDH